MMTNILRFQKLYCVQYGIYYVLQWDAEVNTVRSRLLDKVIRVSMDAVNCSVGWLMNVFVVFFVCLCRFSNLLTEEGTQAGR